MDQKKSYLESLAPVCILLMIYFVISFKILDNIN